MKTMAKKLLTVRLCGTLLTGVVLFFHAGCKPSSEKIARREALINAEIEQLFIRIQDYSGDRIEEALELANAALRNPDFRQQKPRFFAQKIDLLLMLEKVGEASGLILNAWKNEPELARAAFGRVFNYYQQRNANEEIIAWGKHLQALGTDFPNDLRPQVLNWQLTTALNLKDFPSAKTYIDSLLTALKPEEAVPLFQQALGNLLDSGQHLEARELIRHLEARKPDVPPYNSLVAALTLRCVLLANDWPNVTSAFTACVAQLPDDQLLKILRMTFPLLKKNSKSDLMEQTSKLVIFNAVNKTNSVNYAARVWVESGIATSKKLLPERLNALLNAKVSPVQIGNLFDRYFYEMVDDREVVRSLCALGDRILAICTDETTVNTVKVKILDGAFITDNFDLAISMLERGIPGKDKPWHDMSIPKVKAHRAMAQNKPREAVQYFRAFMDAWIVSKQEEEFDPTSGIAYSRDWILGRNANRIANILESIQDKEQAAKARAEAKSYFIEALKKAATDPEALKLLKAETKDYGL
ncbi:MAG: hypothetical protein PHV28_01665 [Kiritimatiellae bacterium]|nr:hypothetical protein [Kiritimatiellia bacterium]